MFFPGGAPDYILDDIFIENLHKVIDWAEELQIHLILDNHTFNPSVNTDPEVGDILNKVWAQMAQEFSGRSEYIYYEILNEPHGIKDMVKWYEALINIFEQVDMSRTMWDYHGSFGLFEEGSRGSFENDLNIPLLKAMKLNIPEVY
ncbi:MAG: cellulase family glycosylhydrolase [Bacteroidales bacterium]|nr:cellulase family glycosylhydrolase [Bacteroidales bacterium]